MGSSEESLEEPAEFVLKAIPLRQLPARPGMSGRYESNSWYFDEINAMYQIDSPNVATCHDHWTEPSSEYLKTTFGMPGNPMIPGMPVLPFDGLILFIVLERCDTDLDKWLRQNPNATSVQKWDIFRQVVNGFCDLHSKNIVHRDLKPQNILISTKEGRITAKVADFGVCRFIPKPEAESNTAVQLRDNSNPPEVSRDVFLTCIGNRRHMPLEMMQQNQVLLLEEEAKPVDIFALGVLLRIMFKMFRPVPAAQGFFAAPVPFEYGFSPPGAKLGPDQRVAKDVIRQLCNYWPDDRPSVEKVRALVAPSAIAEKLIRATKLCPRPNPQRFECISKHNLAERYKPEA